MCGCGGPKPEKAKPAPVFSRVEFRGQELVQKMLTGGTRLLLFPDEVSLPSGSYTSRERGGFGYVDSNGTIWSHGQEIGTDVDLIPLRG